MPTKTDSDAVRVILFVATFFLGSVVGQVLPSALRWSDLQMRNASMRQELIETKLALDRLRRSPSLVVDSADQIPAQNLKID